MKIDGVFLRKAPHLSWRFGNPSEDKNLLGEPIPSGRKVIVRNKEAKGGDLTTAPPIPQYHLTARKAVGRWRHQKNREKGQWIDGELRQDYWTATYYVVMGEKVYYGPLYRLEAPTKEGVIAKESLEKQKAVA